MPELPEASLDDLANPNVDFYDHLPDGTILGKVPLDDADALLDLMRERMAPEVFDEFADGFMEKAAASRK